MELARDLFMASVRNKHIQDILLQSPSEICKTAYDTAMAKWLESTNAGYAKVSTLWRQ